MRAVILPTDHKQIALCQLKSFVGLYSLSTPPKNKEFLKHPETERPDWWSMAIKQFLKTDLVMTSLVNKFPNSHLTRRSDSFEVLVNSIVGQQISVKAADKVRGRLNELVKIAPKSILSMEVSQLRTAGLSQQKATYIQNIARWFKENKVDTDWFHQHSAEEISQNLLQIKGIGKWTLQMFQIFYLHESNILPMNDLGLIRAVENAYQLDRETATSQLPEIAQKKWHPYSTAAVWFLWRSLDSEEVNY